MHVHSLKSRISAVRQFKNSRIGKNVGVVEYEDSPTLEEISSTQVSPQSIESEISDLTWAVIDGRATPEERKRLSELVSQQHQRRELTSD